ncbi:MarC family protein [Candidatus Woesearchaeota archaeon]|nr:MarC family protein [Candidatus Woesearchaeota archaeon]
MELLLTSMLAFLVMLNPVGMFIYLTPVMDDLSHMNFVKVLRKASSISFVILMLFFFTGEFLINNVFQIHFESFRIFGGIIIFAYAFYLIVKGQEGLIHMKENLDDLASEIALPFMVGAGTISLAIIFSYQFDRVIGVLSIACVMGVDYLLILSFKFFKDGISKTHFKTAFDKNMHITLRVWGFFMGAIGVNMVVGAILKLFF